jgi:hypothetical protein
LPDDPVLRKNRQPGVAQSEEGPVQQFEDAIQILPDDLIASFGVYDDARPSSPPPLLG